MLAMDLHREEVTAAVLNQIDISKRAFAKRFENFKV
jgi:hypothetical protein